MNRKYIIALTVACALFMQVLDTTVLGTALPTIAMAFGESVVRLHLAMTAYLLAVVVFMPLSGWLADRWGARAIFQGAVGVFTVSSIACGLANDLDTLVLARIAQGAGGAMMVPVGRLVLIRSVPKSEFVRATVWVTTPASIAPILGPVLGGVMSTYASWRWIFWINIPVGVIGILMAALFMDNSCENKVTRFDTRGFILAGSGFFGLVYTLEMFNEGMLSFGVIMITALCSIAAIGVYVLHARRRSDPIVNVALLAIPTFRASLVGGTLFRSGVGATPFLLPLMLQTGLDHDPVQAGGIMTFIALGALAMKGFAERLLRRYGFRKAICRAALLGAFMVAACAFFTRQTPWWIIIVVMLASGCSRSLLFTGINALIYSDVATKDYGSATGFFSLIQQFSWLFGIGLGAAALTLAQTVNDARTPSLSDFHSVFLGVALLTASSALIFMRIDRTAGHNLIRGRPPEPCRKE
ncbi:MAG: MFS transporter [Hyphomicrobiales bacterium]